MLRPEVRYRFHNSQPLVPILSQFNPLHTYQTDCCIILLLLCSRLLLDLPSGLFFSGFHTTNFCMLLSFLLATCPAHLILLYFIIRIIFYEGTVYEVPHFAVFSSPLLLSSLNRLTPNDPYMGRTAPLTSKRCILYIYSTNTGTEYFKHALYSPFFLFKMQFVS